MLPVSLRADQMIGCPVIWRPWDLSIRQTQFNKMISRRPSRVRVPEEAFHHPVRLFLPRSRMQEYLSHLGRKVLASFPVQATLHFYNDEDSEDESDGTHSD
ncbi:protein ripply3 [Triplophysa rosa]|uniref:protein ripply3 n=1 Tax=Triplophysa rosa TaxID=992332 RepID=UPI002545F27B|nr:protein ripply3 [Triplophysa rosa]XP_057176740.1 protein ripply3 [Triplophysa rosa]